MDSTRDYADVVNMPTAGLFGLVNVVGALVLSA